MKVVINDCFGGFGLSDKAVKELYRRGSKFVKAMKPEEYFGKSWIEDNKRCLRDMDEKNSFHMPVENGLILTEDYSYGEYSSRADQLLIDVVEKLKEAADGHCAKLKIVEIPDNIDWEIGEYDGWEKIDEAHQSWS